MQTEKRLIYADDLREEIESLSMTVTGLRAGKGVLGEFMKQYRDSVLRIIDEQPAVDAVEIKTIEAWLYEIALNNVGVKFDGDFSKACEAIISRLDGLRAFARDRIEDV